MSSGTRLLSAVGQDLTHFSGLVRLGERWKGGAGVILAFGRVQPPQTDRSALGPAGMSPEHLDRLIEVLTRWKFDIVALDEACRRATQPRSGRRFVALTFDGLSRDVMTHAYPVLSRRDVPFAVYIPTAFPDGLGRAWWLALQEVVARHDRISLVLNGRDRHFSAPTAAAKRELHELLLKWLQSLATPDLSVAINDLCGRYSVDLARLSREAAIDWADVARFAADPRVTLGSMTVNHPVLSAVSDDEARREMAMGRAVAEAAIGRKVTHFAYPFGQRRTFDARHVRLAGELGFTSAVSAVAGVVEARGRTNLLALPRIGWDGGPLRRLRVKMSGLVLPDDR